MSKIYLLIGPPASGKSTWTNDFLSKTDEKFVIASTDNIIEEFARKNNINYNEAFSKIDFASAQKSMFEQFRTAVSEKTSVIVDRTNMTVKSRAKFLSQIPKATYEKIAVVFYVPVEELYRRTQKRADETGKYISPNIIDNFVLSYEAPTLDEFDSIIEVPYTEDKGSE